MDTPNEKEVVRLMKEAVARSRGYASFFDWLLDRDRAEFGVVESTQQNPFSGELHWRQQRSAPCHP